MGSVGSSGDETDAIGGVASPRAVAAERLGRPGALLPGRTVGQSFTQAFAAGALLGSGLGGGIGLVLGLFVMGEVVAGFALVVAAAGALIGVFVGLVCACGAATGVFLAVRFGAPERWAKITAGMVGAVLGVLVVGGIVEANGVPILTDGLTNGFAPGVTPAFLVLLAGAAAGLSISVLDSDSRRVAAMRADEQTRTPGVARADAAVASAVESAVAAHTVTSPSGFGGDDSSAARRGPPPIPNRSARETANAADISGSEGVGTPFPAPAASVIEHGERGHLLARALQFRSVAVILGILSLVSVPWMLLVLRSVSAVTFDRHPELFVAWCLAQFCVAAAIPAVALGFALASGVVGRRARQRGASDAELTPTPGGVALLTGCVLAVTILAGLLLFSVLGELESSGEQHGQSKSENAPVEQDVPPVVADPESQSHAQRTQLTASEVTAGMQELLDVAFSAAGPTAVWSVSNGDGTYSALGNVAADVPPAVTFESCAVNAGTSSVFPDVNFTTGVITDTSTDEHDREVTDGNVAASRRIVAAWEALGYHEDSSALGGNIDFGGAADLPAKSLHMRYSFGLVTLVRVGQCLPNG